ncbi:MAG: ATP-binding cassette domain-containing protein [Propionibacteriaceae bacterium]|jgi:putative ABC transport system ATP-binding protein|nr:ATP-binding cassette domain-containing protein [Propionibacteriaceae bacterium]
MGSDETATLVVEGTAPVREAADWPGDGPGEVLRLVTRGFGKRFGRRVLWQNWDFQLAAGEICALRGESGSGKTTFLHCLGGLEPFDGRVEVDGLAVQDLRGRSRRRYLADTVTFLFQNYGLVDQWSARRNLDIVRGRRPAAGFALDAQNALEQAGLEIDLGQPTQSLSGGEQQRLSLARASLKGGRLMLADEPTSALDDANAARLADVLLALADQGATVLIATHDPRVQRICTRQLILGQLGDEDGPTTDQLAGLRAEPTTPGGGR